jgi:hypothetical protein
MDLQSSNIGWRSAVTRHLVCLLVMAALPAQSELRGWGKLYTTTEAREGTFVHVDAGLYTTGLVREDGRPVFYGQNTTWGNCEATPLPAGLRYQKLAMGMFFTLGLLSDGNIIGIGSLNLGGAPVQIPALPSGMRYVDIDACADHALLLRSDGVVLGIGNSQFGQLAIPPLPPGRMPVDIAAGGRHSAILYDDGTIAAFGNNAMGQCNVPSLPYGMGYTSVDAYGNTTVALRSDGALLAWGDNSYGQCNVPSGTYQRAAAGGYHTAAWRSDGTFVVFGDNARGQRNAPVVAPGVDCKVIACGILHTVALMSDGSVLSWGNDSLQQSTVPTLPIDPTSGGRARVRSVASGGPYSACVLSDGTMRLWGHEYLASMPLPFANKNLRRVELGYGTAVVMTEDGNLLAWGDNTDGRATVPPLPPGVRYVDYDECWAHTVAIRSDGNAVRFGTVQGTLPALPAGQHYLDADAESVGTLFLRSDGAVFCVGCVIDRAVAIVPPAPSGLRYTQVAHCFTFGAALRSDGTIALWGNVPAGSPPLHWRGLPALPSGVVYVEISGGEDCIAARRSDGEVVVGGWTSDDREHVVPPLQPGTSYVEVDGGDQSVAARVGPTSTYISFYQGCAGTRPATRLIPSDTPRIGNPLEVRLFDLPIDFAFVALGFTRTAPIPLDFAGMPGCESHVTLDHITFAAGQGGQATISVPIPDRRSLIGARFYQQVFVLDPAAGNPAGAVVSAAAEAVVGDW